MKERLVSVPVVIILAAAGAMGTSAGSPASAPASARTVPASRTSPSGSVTLITGDRVEVGGGGPPRIIPGPGRRSMPFRVAEDKGHIRVVPGDAAALVATGRLDQRLFDVTTLLDDGYGDTQRKDLSLIVQYDAGTPRRPMAAVESTGRQLSSVHGASISVSKKDAPTWWNAATHPDRGTRTLDSGLTKVWLNGRRHLAQDQNASQIGAPAAWQAGLTGKNVRVAILDSGIDSTHPDLVGKVEASANFTSEPSGDLYGHGTHVASIVAGSGAASGGMYQGIAPGVRLLDAKVCDQAGSCADDAIIAGMQWAAAQHASVANASLGEADTPGIDPVEQAVNTLSAQYGMLFVVAAGNSGPGDSTVESPGSADAALTVGAVDGQDVIAGFSGRGPTVGGTLKPDLAAPGVDIVAARAAGTELGEIVDDQYVKLSGTSMATPHVTAAAAILFQQHPDWTGEQVKEALMASAKTLDTTGVFDQGAGRVDIAKAIAQTVMAQPASLSFGVALWPHEDDTVTSKTVTYHNTGTTDIPLDLALEATGPDGTPAPAELFTVNPARIVVPAGGTQQITVAADTRSDQVPVGRYSGRLIATGGGSTLTSPVAVEKESERYSVRITHIGRDGGAPGSYVTYLDRIGDCGTDPYCGGLVSGSDGQSSLRLPPGRYTLAEFSTTAGRNDMNFLMQPVLDVEGDISLTVDARRADPVQLTAPRKSARLMEWELDAVRDVHRPGQVLTYFTGGDYSTALYTADLGGPPAGKDELVGFVQGRLAEPGPGDDYVNSPYEYELADASFGQLFTGLRLHPAQRDFATVDARYDAVTDQSRDVKTEHFARPASGPEQLFQFAPYFGATRLLAKAPFHRTEYYLARGLRWTSRMQQGDVQTGALDFLLAEGQWHEYQPGHTYRPVPWSQGVFGPNFRRDPQLMANGAANGVLRRGDHFAAGIDMFVDCASDHLSEPKAQRGTAQLYRDGQLIGTWPNFGYAVAELPPGAATYRLAATATPAVSQISTTITSAWTFQSKHVDGDQAVALPLLNVRYAPALDEYNHARPGERYLIPVEVSRQPGAGTATIAQLTVEASYDDGKTWRKAPLARNGAGWVATVNNPPGGSVSLRAHVQDTDRNELDQTIIRAYLVNG